MSSPSKNLTALNQEIDWLIAVINQVICSYLKHEGHENDWMDIPAPDLYKSVGNDISSPNSFHLDNLDPVEQEEEPNSIYAKSVLEWNLSLYERLTLALAMAPHLKPEALDVFFGINQITGRGFTEFGGITDKTFSGFLPTGQTLVFLISANSPLLRTNVNFLLASHHIFSEENIVYLETSDHNLPALSGALTLSDQWLHYFLTGEKVRPELSTAFPATPISTSLNWSDLVLDHTVMEQVEEIRAWITHGETLMSQWGLSKKVKPGYRSVFYGPPGTGKTLTASLLAKSTGREIYRVDLSMIVSKYIGETEKNLSRLFDVASHKDWILFFDEADALFGKRTASETSNDRHANQQTGYLLQRIEDFPGTVILATNLKANMDDAFTRRFQSMIHFTIPSPAQRLQLWENAFCDVCDLDASVDLVAISKHHELAGGSIINVLRQCVLNAISCDRKFVTQDDLTNGIRRELRKDNITMRASQ